MIEKTTMFQAVCDGCQRKGVANTYAEGVSDMLLDKRIEDYAAYKAQQIMRDHEPAYNVH